MNTDDHFSSHFEEFSTTNYQIADTGSRIGAYLIDVLIGIGIIMASFVFGFAFGIIPIIGPLIVIAGYLAGILYIILRDAWSFLDGRSLGKRAMGIRVVTQYGHQSVQGMYGKVFLRHLPFLIPIFGLIEVIYFLVAIDHIRFGDQWAETKVVRDK